MGLGTTAKFSICGCAAVLLIVTIGLLAGSWAVVTTQEYGVKWNAVTKTLDDSQVYQAGRWYVGVGGSFTKYPRQYQYVEFSSSGRNSLDVWSKDGQQVYVEASFYYSIKPAKVLDIFYLYNQNLHQVVTGLAAETIRDVAVSFDTIDFFTNRSAIDNAMTAALTTSLASVVEVDLFNLLAVDIPDTFDAAVQDKVLTGQDVITLEQQRTVNVIRSQIAVIDASADANVTAIVANATAQGLVISANTQAATGVQYMGARGSALALLASDLGFNSTGQLLQYLYTDIIRGNTRAAPVLAVDIDAATVRV